MNILLLLFFSFCSFSIDALEPEKSAKYMMDYHLVSIRDYSRYEDFTNLKTLFVDYPKEFDTEYKWPKIMKTLKDYEFTTLNAEYISFDSNGKPTGINGKVTLTIGNKTITEEIRVE
uniref:GLPGLI family protein n=1 Tax=Caenorhabditis tropicalis TaxID=1561998 RepID=A0A1I7UFG6_9PELO